MQAYRRMSALFCIILIKLKISRNPIDFILFLLYNNLKAKSRYYYCSFLALNCFLEEKMNTYENHILSNPAHLVVVYGPVKSSKEMAYMLKSGNYVRT